MTIAYSLTKDAWSVEGLTHAACLAKLAREALVAEAELTPKPGLVDQRGSGAHFDLSLDLMRRSASVIAPYFELMAEAANDGTFDLALRAELASIGRDAEAAMLAVTHGSNAHKGAIWVLGLLVAAAGGGIHIDAATITRDAGWIARLADPAQLQAESHGALMRRRYGVGGARGEASAGFPHVTSIGLPTLRAARREGRTESNSRLYALLSIMAQLDDTCVLYRGGIKGPLVTQQGARGVLNAGGPGSSAGDQALQQLDHALLALHISPGGSADLLAATLFLDAVEQSHDQIEPDTSFSGGSDGTN